MIRSAVYMCIVLVLSACTSQDRITTPVLPEAAGIGSTKTVFFATSRAKRSDGQFGIARSSSLTFGRADISLPPNRDVGTISYGFDAPDPATDFVVSELEEYSGAARFQSSLQTQIYRQPRGAREVSVFVHGFNTSFSEALFRLAQLQTDLQIPGASIAYAWPSRAAPLGYEYDEDSALIARNGLEALLRDVNRTDNGGIVLVGHSMGSLVIMEALRQIERQSPGWSARNLAGVVLISPDLDIDVFMSQMAEIERIPEPFVIFTSQQDRALGLSAFITGEEERLGNIKDINRLGDLPVTILDVTALSDQRGLNHFVPGSSPALIAMVREARRVDPEFLAGDHRGDGRFLNADQRFVRNATELVVRPFR